MTDPLDTLTAADEPAEAGDLEGQVLDGRYELTKRLGAGGMGVVYAARHVILNSRLAVKVLRPPPASHAAEAIERFRREARAASALGHPNIVDVRDFGTLEGGLSYYVMEQLEGSDLLAEIERHQAMPAPRLAHIGMQVADALYAAHEQGIVHRDLKPENVFLTTRNGESDHVKLIDFGIAKVTSGDVANTLPPMGQMALGMMPLAPSRGRFTAAGIVLGTPAYMSPEQCAGRDVDFRSDLYALGVLLYEAATGLVPFDADSVFELMRMHQQATPPDPRVLVPDLPDPIAELILACLAKDPSKRPADMRAVQAALAPFAPVMERPTALSIAASMRASTAAPRPSQAGDTPIRLLANDLGIGDGPSFATPQRPASQPPSGTTQPPPAKPSVRWPAVALASIGVVALGLTALLVATRPPSQATDAIVAESRAEAPVATAASVPAVPAGPVPTESAARSVDAPVSIPSMPSTPPEASPEASRPVPLARPARRARPRADEAAATAAPEPTPPSTTEPATTAPRHARPTDAVRDPWAD